MKIQLITTKDKVYIDHIPPLERGKGNDSLLFVGLQKSCSLIFEMNKRIYD